MFNVSLLYSMSSFGEQIVSTLIMMNKHFLPREGEQKRNPCFLDHISCKIFQRKYKYLQRKLNQLLIFAKILSTKSLLKHQPKNSCLHYNTIWKISYLRTAAVYENFIFTQKYAFTERCCFLTFSFERKFRKYDISVKQTKIKLTKANKSMTFSAIFTTFCPMKIIFFMQRVSELLLL